MRLWPYSRLNRFFLESMAKNISSRQRTSAISIGFGWVASMNGLGNIAVDLIKNGFRFVHARFISEQMDEFEKNFLQQHTPCIFRDKNRIIKALAEVHTELVLIHPFRDGNGRVARLLATLMALQAGFPPLNFNVIKESKKREYIAAVHASVVRNYDPMEKIFRWVLEKSIPRTRRA